MLIQIARSAGLQNAPANHHADAIAERKGFFLIVCDVNGGQSKPRNQLAQLAARFFAQGDVKIRERLVKKQQRRLNSDGARDGHALLLAAGEFVDAALLVTRKLDQLQCAL